MRELELGFEELELFDGPITPVDAHTLLVRVYDEISGTGEEYEITVQDVVQYYLTQGQDLASGIRVLGPPLRGRCITGDWRLIENIASDCIEAFKVLDIAYLREMARKKGLEPRF